MNIYQHADEFEAISYIPSEPDRSGVPPCWQYLPGVRRRAGKYKASPHITHVPLGSGE
jgi:hypothetical protein